MKKILLTFVLFFSLVMHAQIKEEGFEKKGFEPQLRISFDEGIDSYKNFSFGLDIIASYRINEYFRIGAGTGLNYVNLAYEKSTVINGKYFKPYYESAMAIPIFANIKANFTKTKISPYLTFDAGYNFFIPFSKYAQKNKLGAFFKPTLGVDFHFSSCTLFIELAYRYQMREFTLWTNSHGDYSQLSQSIGLQF